MASEHFDVLIIGAGLSGIGAAFHLQRRCAGLSYAILEARERIGGTWDLFRYPGVRSDSDMYTLGYAFKPWRDAQAIADGPSILRYIEETARENAILERIRFASRVRRASWSSQHARWTLDVAPANGGEAIQLTCNFLFACSGYYSYEEGYTPEFPGVEHYSGRIVHPQHWSDDVRYAGKELLVIGSGATAVTLVPELAKSASHVTMLQRSPTYVVARPGQDRIANWLRGHLPLKLAYWLTRWKQVLLGMFFYNLCRRRPERAKQLLLKGVRMWLGTEFDVDTHFTPRYKPWDQRLCLVPDGDLFKALNSGRASVVTDEIECFTARGVKLASGREIVADLIVTATGLNLQVLGGVQLLVDGQVVDPARTINYKGLMYSEIPNLAAAFGYTNASWTLKCDLSCEFVCRLLNHMKKRGYAYCTPRRGAQAIEEEAFVDFTSGYFQRSLHKFPKQGRKTPWRLHQNYVRDIALLRWGRLEDGVLEFSMPGTP